jgi:LmbE family N-acetylglucosaminyl deacetylase
MTDALKLICIVAHPDDETLGMGGILAKYHAEGIETYLLTAIRGECGWQGNPAEDPGPKALGTIREAELRAAAAVLGISEVQLLDYLDSDLDKASPQDVIGRIVEHLRRIRPQGVITFGPDGTYGHPDHIAICQFATAAAACAGDADYQSNGARQLAPHRVQKLYYMVETEATANQYRSLFGDIVMPVDGEERRMVTWNDWAITTRIDTTGCGQKIMQAVSCHQSQLASLGAVEQLTVEQQQHLRNPQTFYRAFSLVNGGRALETDLFAGLR